MLALVDGDIVAFRCAASAENDNVEIACARARESLEQMLGATNASSYEVWLSDTKENNFRYKILESYKANRTQPKPRHLVDVQQYLLAQWSANIAAGQEADDALGIRQTRLAEEPHNKGQPNSIICSIDKDLLQIPGQHYNFVKMEFHEQDYIGGTRQFYSQLLIGDVSDNIKGVSGIGKVKAGRILEPMLSETEMFQRVRTLYGDDERLLANGQVLKIRTYEGELWRFPDGYEEEGHDSNQD